MLRLALAFVLLVHLVRWLLVAVTLRWLLVAVALRWLLVAVALRWLRFLAVCLPDLSALAQAGQSTVRLLRRCVVQLLLHLQLRHTLCKHLLPKE